LKPCTICRHPERDGIETATLGGTAYRDIAQRYQLSKSAVGRHRKHLPDILVEANDAAEVARADSALAKIVALHRRAEQILAGAERDGLLETALRAIREARSCLELIARLEGSLKEARVNVMAIELDASTASRLAETYLQRRAEIPAHAD
jgi:hypothetical protein